MADAYCEWLEGFSTEYLVESIHTMKNELLRRGLDECGLPMPILHSPVAKHYSPAERERARIMIDDHIDLIPIPRRAHHDCSCPKTAYHQSGCEVAANIRTAARNDLELEQQYLETLSERPPVTTIKVHGRIEVES
jgi:hypothetical protein